MGASTGICFLSPTVTLTKILLDLGCNMLIEWNWKKASLIESDSKGPPCREEYKGHKKLLSNQRWLGSWRTALSSITDNTFLIESDRVLSSIYCSWCDQNFLNLDRELRDDISKPLILLRSDFSEVARLRRACSITEKPQKPSEAVLDETSLLQNNFQKSPDSQETYFHESPNTQESEYPLWNMTTAVSWI